MVSLPRRPREPPDSPPTKRKSFADILAGTTDQRSPPIKEPSTYRGKPVVLFTKNEIARMAEKYKFALVGKFSHGRPLLDDIRKKFASFGLKGAYTIGANDAKHIVINWMLEEDFIRLWMKTTWYLDSRPMRLFKWSTEFHPHQESPLAPVWIKFPYLPLHLYNKSALFSIAQLVGRPLKVDEPTANTSRPSVARVCVELDISAPKLSTVWVGEYEEESPDEIDGYWQEVEYEPHPDYCSYCNHVGHKELNCFQKHPDRAIIRVENPQENSRVKGKAVIQEGSDVKGKEVAQEGTLQTKKLPIAQGDFMKDARKSTGEDLRQWREVTRKHDTSTSAPQINVIESTEANMGDTVEENELQLVKGNDVLMENDKEGEENEPEMQAPLLCVSSNSPIDIQRPLDASNKQVEDALLEVAEKTQIDHSGDGNYMVGEQSHHEVVDQVECQHTNTIHSSLLGHQNEFSKDDLMLLKKHHDGDRGDDIEAFDGPSAHPHVHSRRKSDGYVDTGLEKLIPFQDLQNQCKMDESQNENLRRSTRTKKLTFKSKKHDANYVKAKSEGVWQGLNFGRTGPMLTHLSFADDSLLSLRASWGVEKQLLVFLNPMKNPWGSQLLPSAPFISASTYTWNKLASAYIWVFQRPIRGLPVYD